LELVLSQLRNWIKRDIDKFHRKLENIPDLPSFLKMKFLPTLIAARDAFFLQA
jgi:hypothetical protein